MTLKQDKAIRLITSGQSDNVGQAMRGAGYSVSTSKTPARLTNSKAWQKKLGALAKANNVTIEQYMMNLGLGMTADKMNQFTGEITPDYITRLNANRQAEKFLQLDSKQVVMTKEQVIDIADGADEVEIQRVLFKKNTVE